MYFTVGDINASITVIKNGLKKNSDSAQLHSLLGDCYRRIDRSTKLLLATKKVYSWKQKTLMLT